MKAQTDPPFQILQVNLQSDRGGDGRIVADLHKGYRALGYPASMLVGRGSVTAEAEDMLPNDAYRSRWASVWLGLARQIPGQSSAGSKIAKSMTWIAEPTRRRRIREGFEDFEFPATLPVISQIIRERLTILHLHNLHGGYFDLRALPALSDIAPVVLTLHDQWAFTGHCGYSYECERWRLGCGKCPDLTIYPGIPKDRTAENFAAKRQIFSHTRLYLTAPSKWLLDNAQQSLLAPAIEEARVIPNGVDTSVFRPGDKAAERSRLELPRGSRILLCAGSVARADRQTNQRLLRSTLRYLAEGALGDCTVLFLGSAQSASEHMDGIQVIHRPYERDVSRVAGYYRASDVFVHPALADNFPTAVLESLACGVPVVATDVGGIPEQVRSLWSSKNALVSPPHLATGILVDDEDTTGLGRAIDLLLRQDDLRSRLGENGSRVALAEFSINRQVQRNLDWYREILSQRSPSAPSAAGSVAQRRGLLR